MFHSMTPKIVNLYDCEFVTFKPHESSRILKVAAYSFGEASKLASIQSTYWDDSDSFELVSVRLLGNLVVGF